MILRKLYTNEYEQRYCSDCNEAVNCPHCCLVSCCCENCGLEIFNPEVFILHSTDKYNGWCNPSSHTATLIIDGDEYASAHIDVDASDAGGDIAYLQLGYIQQSKQNDSIAKIIVDFAKWVRFEWYNPDKQNDLPTLVRLIGFVYDENYEPGTLRYKRFVVLWDATKISKEYLSYEATHRTANQEAAMLS